MKFISVDISSSQKQTDDDFTLELWTFWGWWGECGVTEQAGQRLVLPPESSPDMQRGAPPGTNPHTNRWESITPEDFKIFPTRLLMWSSLLLLLHIDLPSQFNNLRRFIPQHQDYNTTAVTEDQYKPALSFCALVFHDGGPMGPSAQAELVLASLLNR